MDIEIHHCNNIVRARIILTPDKLNIKFAPNGTGKSTLSRAISCAAQNNTQATVLKVKIMEQRGGTTHPILRSF